MTNVTHSSLPQKGKRPIFIGTKNVNRWSSLVGIYSAPVVEAHRLTSNGVLCDDSAVNPTMSLKKRVTSSKLSASTGRPLFN